MTRSLPGRPVAFRNPSKFLFSKCLSTASASDTRTEAEIREQILRSALANVPLLGWTDDAVAKAMKDVGYDPVLKRYDQFGESICKSICLLSEGRVLKCEHRVEEEQFRV